jgi:glucose-6-phosphate 1-epimerase
LPQGDTPAGGMLHGAHVLTWVSGGQERLYLSPQSTMDGQAAMRGGVPVCFPQFNQRGPMADRLPKHGFARNVAWQADAPVLTHDSAQLCLHLQDNARTRAWWPQAFALGTAHRPCARARLRISLHVHNTDAHAAGVLLGHCTAIWPCPT